MGGRLPAATYRLQLSGAFTLRDAAAVVDYLDALGISDLYASPLLCCRTGSPHGYDVVDPTRVDPERGGAEGLEALAGALRGRGMGLLLDIVPNHMAASAENPWWADVLRHGPSSRWAPVFDLVWSPALSPLRGTILLAVLGKPYGQALEQQEISLAFGPDGFTVRSSERRLPVDPRSVRLVLRDALDGADDALPAGSRAAVKALVSRLEAIPERDVAEPYLREQRRSQAEAASRELLALVAADAHAAAALEASVRRFNGTRGEPASFDLLDRFLHDQAYRVAFWKTGREKLNFRRFFNINDLIGVRVEDPEVLAATHGLVFRLVREGLVTGLRVDHVDGLRDPLAYLLRLQDHLAPVRRDLFVVVEKILGHDEALPDGWPVAGTTGYEFAAAVNHLQVDGQGVSEMIACYRRFTGEAGTFADVVYRRKKLVSRELFSAEMGALERRLVRLAESDRWACDLSVRELGRALEEVTAALPVYRTYTRSETVRAEDRRVVQRTVATARRQAPAVSARALGFLGRLLSLEMPPSLTAGERAEWLEFVRSWQQLTPPLMAKGLEDTALYVYNAVTSLNEVGCGPSDGGVQPESFHRFAAARLAAQPGALNATSTHDTKRSEDVRARLHVLTEMPDEWERRVEAWSRWNDGAKRLVGGMRVPEPAAEALFYQTLAGVWPLDEADWPALPDRLAAYMVKARREAKSETSWLQPNEAYERGLVRFVGTVLGRRDSRFLADFADFHARIALPGAVNSLAAVLLRSTAPGIPDLYQGCEVWDFSLVDPDNRRPVDFARRRALLGEVDAASQRDPRGTAAALFGSWRDGRVKLLVTAAALRLRRRLPELFAHGAYHPVAVRGSCAAHACAFARADGATWSLTVVPRLLTRLVPLGAPPLGRAAWGDDALVLPAGAPASWRDVLTGETVDGDLRLADVFATLPVALLVAGDG